MCPVSFFGNHSFARVEVWSFLTPSNDPHPAESCHEGRSHNLPGSLSSGRLSSATKGRPHNLPGSIVSFQLSSSPPEKSCLQLSSSIVSSCSSTGSFHKCCCLLGPISNPFVPCLFPPPDIDMCAPDAFNVFPAPWVVSFPLTFVAVSFDELATDIFLIHSIAYRCLL